MTPARRRIETGAGSSGRPRPAFARETFDRLLLERVIDERSMTSAPRSRWYDDPDLESDRWEHPRIKTGIVAVLP